ncbi:hypothetical protein SDC9_80999 [bioreactor metagenome]|uniref:Uncharacterized protein n=1 Tax=bioreactor metagenome TaxID=1076179 RepID=A0A644Z0R4_9ZZZZ
MSGPIHGGNIMIAEDIQRIVGGQRLDRAGEQSEFQRQGFSGLQLVGEADLQHHRTVGGLDHPVVFRRRALPALAGFGEEAETALFVAQPDHRVEAEDAGAFLHFFGELRSPTGTVRSVEIFDRAGGQPETQSHIVERFFRLQL